MWLINVHTIQHDEFASAQESDVQYAILSHTWEAEEVTFQEFRSDTETSKKGFSKIEQTCKRALQDGLSYAWVDSCCINKESSAELTMAINSMWQWYWEAHICYAFLSDLDEECPLLEDQSGETNHDEDVECPTCWHERLAASRWFTRSLTLQELLAPEQVCFFNSQWTLVGTKQSLIETLSSMTSVDPVVLMHREALPTCSIAKRMSWATGRSTKNIEDRAYSLLGLFSVNMPLLYGEGKRAFIRLREEIIKTSMDQSIFIWGPDQFRGCGKVIPWQEIRVNTKYQLTNRGVTFDKLRVCRSDYGTFAALNCRYEDDLRGPLTLRVCTEDYLSLNFERWTLLARNDFWIGFDERTRSRAVKLVPWVVNERLIVHPSGDFPRTSATDDQTTLLREHPAVAAAAGVPYGLSRQFPKIWLRQSDDSLFKFDVSEASPARYWNTETSTMNVPAHIRPPKTIVAAAELSPSKRMRPVYLALSIAMEKAIDIANGEAEGMKFCVVLSALSMADAKEVLRQAAPCMSTSLNLTASRRLEANTRLEQHLTEVAFVVTIKVEETDPEASSSTSREQQNFGRVVRNYGGGGYSGGGGSQPRDDGKGG